MEHSSLPLELAQMDIRPGHEDAFARELSEAAPIIERATGCRSVSIYRSHEEPRRFRILVIWNSIEDHLRFRQSEDVLRIREMFARHVVSRVATEHLLRIYP